MSTAVKLAGSAEALAALAAHVRVESEQLDTDERVRQLLATIAGEIVGGEPELGPSSAPIVGMAKSFLRQAVDLVDHPGHAGGWDHVDEEMLQGIGRLSMAITDAFRAAGPELSGLADRLAGPDAAFLDVGTGTGWLAIATARLYPAARVVGIDIFPPSLGLARQNVAGEGLGERIEIRQQDVTDLSEVDAYDAIWLPMPFLPLRIVPAAIAACRRALRPGGWLLPGTFAGPGDRLSQLLVDLRTVRAGGHPWTTDELVAELFSHELADAHEVPRTWAAPVRLYAARKP